MRKAVRLLALASVVVALVTAALGWVGARFAAPTHAAGLLPATPQGGGLALAHAVVAAASVASACVVAAITFLIGLHGLLAADGRRLRAGMLFGLGPLLMGLAFWAALTGWKAGRGDLLPQGIAAEPGHHVSSLAFLGASILALAAAHLLVPGARDDEAADSE